MTTRNISKKREHGFLVMENILIDWVNATMEYPIDAPRPFSQATRDLIARADAGIRRLLTRYPEVFSALPAVEPAPPSTETTIPTTHWQIVAIVQLFLRRSWDAPDLRAREWYIFKARDEWQKLTTFNPIWEKRVLTSGDGRAVDELTDEEWGVKIQPPSPLAAFEKMMWHFHRIAERARHCANPECPAPYFFAIKRGQKFCSSKCAAPSQRDQKRRWWRENRAKSGGE